jgi:hypothetical protein
MADGDAPTDGAVEVKAKMRVVSASIAEVEHSRRATRLAVVDLTGVLGQVDGEELFPLALDDAGDRVV